MADYADVERIALALPEAEAGTTYRMRAWKVGGSAFVWERPLRKKEIVELGDAAPTGPILAMYAGNLVAKDSLIASEPDVFFQTAHYENYPALLIALERITPQDLEDVIAEAWLNCAPKPLADAYLLARAARE